MDRAKAHEGRPPEASTRARLSDLGVSYDQSSKWQQLAAVAEELRGCACLPKPSTAGIHGPRTSALISSLFAPPAAQHQQLDQLILGQIVHQALAGVGNVDLVLVAPKAWLPWSPWSENTSRMLAACLVWW
jgi:hypothetical protein